MHKEFKDIVSAHYAMEKLALVLEVTGGVAATLAAKNLIFNHLAPSATFATATNTDSGQRAMATAFAVGVEHGKQGKIIDPATRGGVTSFLHKDFFKDYDYGVQVGQALRDSKRRDLRRDERLKYLYQDMVNRFGDTPEKLQQLKKAPVLGSFYRYMNKDESAKLRTMIESRSRKKVPSTQELIEGSAGRSLGYAVNALNPLSLVTKPAAEYAQRKMEDAKRTDVPVYVRYPTNVFISPRTHDYYRLHKFLDNQTNSKRVLNRYLDLPQAAASLQYKRFENERRKK